MKNEFNVRLESYILQVNAALDRYLPKEGGKYDAVRRAMRYSVDAGGKRIRPLLTLEFARLNGLAPEKALPFGCAVELVHTYSLIHDDLPCMDDDALRRGKPSCHVAFGEANALLAGDALLTYAFELIARAGELTGLSAKASVRASSLLARYAGISGMVGGQVMDLENEGKPVDAETLRQTYLLKTSALLSAGCAMGAVAAEGGDAAVDTAVRYGEAVGLAFQTVDDILDVEGDEATLGKPIGSDTENNKVTTVALYTLDGARKLASRLTDEALELAASLPDSGFLQELTRWLLARKN